MFFQRLRQVAWLAVLALCIIFPAQATFADSFGSSSYGSCGYGGSCTANAGSGTSTPSNSTFQLSSGLLIAVNLQNGQAIPESGYTIIVTPLNGQGTSFKSIAYVINGTTVHTTTPASDGTASWLWLPREYPGTHVTIDATDQNGQATDKSYTIVLASYLRQNAAGVVVTTAPTITPHGAIGKLIAKLPRPVIYSFPYILFGLLALSICIAVVQIYREVREAEILQKDLDHLRQITAAKGDFISLASHYLRTPLTLLEGGLEMLPEATPKRAGIQQLVERLHTKTEALLSGYEAEQVVPSGDTANPHIYRSVRFWLPLALAGILAFCFDYLAESGGALTLSHANTYIQIVIFIILATTSYMLVRSRQLRQRDTKQLRSVLKYEAVLADKREAFVGDSVSLLSADTAGLSSAVRSLPTGQATKFIQDGVDRLDIILAKCTQAVSLRGVSSINTAMTVNLAEFIQHVATPMKTEATKHNINIVASGTGTFSCTNPDLLSKACNDILSNALSYAPQASEITIKGSHDHARTTIAITDHGSGIAEDTIRLLFEPFAKGEAALNFNHEGAGLSLYLDKLIMLYLGGKITIESKPNVATTVQLVLCD
jgi:signal transduction histidine kinase